MTFLTVFNNMTFDIPLAVQLYVTRTTKPLNYSFGMAT